MLGADNWLHPLAIERMSQANVDIASSDIVLFGEQVDEFRTGLPTTYKDGFYIWNVGGIHGSSLFNTELAKSVGGYKRNEKSIKSEEDKMLFDAMLNAGATHKHITEPLLFYRRHKHNFQ